MSEIPQDNSDYREATRPIEAAVDANTLTPRELLAIISKQLHDSSLTPERGAEHSADREVFFASHTISVYPTQVFVPEEGHDTKADIFQIITTAKMLARAGAISEKDLEHFLVDTEKWKSHPEILPEHQRGELFFLSPDEKLSNIPDAEASIISSCESLTTDLFEWAKFILVRKQDLLTAIKKSKGISVSEADQEEQIDSEIEKLYQLHTFLRGIVTAANTCRDCELSRVLTEKITELLPELDKEESLARPKQWRALLSEVSKLQRLNRTLVKRDAELSKPISSAYLKQDEESITGYEHLSRALTDFEASLQKVLISTKTGSN